MNIRIFRCLKALDTRQAYHPADLPGDLLEALETSDTPDWTARFDRELEG